MPFSLKVAMVEKCRTLSVQKEEQQMAAKIQNGILI